MNLIINVQLQQWKHDCNLDLFFFNRWCWVVVRKPWMSPPHPPKLANSMPGFTISCLRRNLGGSKVILVQSTVQHFIQMAKGKASLSAICEVLDIVNIMMSRFRLCHLYTYQFINKLRMFYSGLFVKTHYVPVT